MLLLIASLKRAAPRMTSSMRYRPSPRTRKTVVVLMTPTVTAVTRTISLMLIPLLHPGRILLSTVRFSIGGHRAEPFEGNMRTGTPHPQWQPPARSIADFHSTLIWFRVVRTEETRICVSPITLAL